MEHLFDFALFPFSQKNTQGLDGPTDDSGTGDSILSFLSSFYFHAALFQVILLNRISAIVAPQTPRPPSKIAVWTLHLPVLSFLIYVLRQVGRNLGKVEPGIFKYIFMAQSLHNSVDLFAFALENPVGVIYDRILDSPNTVEWAMTMYFTQLAPDRNILLEILGLNLLEMAVLNIMALAGLKKNNLLVPTSLFGAIYIGHFICAALRGNISKYPSLVSLSRIPEIWIITIIAMVAFLHYLTMLFTGGQIRTRAAELWLPRISLSNSFGFTLVKMGTRCLEATQRLGLITESDKIIVPQGLNSSGFGTKEIKKPSNSSRVESLTVSRVLYTTCFKTLVAGLKLVVRPFALIRNRFFSKQTTTKEANDFENSDTSDDEFEPITSSSSECNESDEDLYQEIFDLAVDMQLNNESQVPIPNQLAQMISEANLRTRTKKPETQISNSPRMCVVCYTEPRVIVLKPCGCLALCDDCRQSLAIRRFKECPCCRQVVDAYSRIYEP